MEPADALLNAIKTDDLVALSAVLERYPELRARLDEPFPHDGFGATPLLAAVERRNREMIDALLGAGADVNARSHWWAGSFGVLDQPTGLEEFLIERGARVDVHAAARLGRLDELQRLVTADPSLVHARGGDGQTPLHFAATVEIAEFLLARGAEIDALDIDHESTAAQYMARDRRDVARYLVSRGSRTDLLLAAALGDCDLIRRHLDADPESIAMSVCEEWFPKRNPRAGGSIYIWVLGQNRTAQRIAHDFGHEEAFRLLMQRTAEEMKLAIACELGDEAAIRQLLDAHAGLAAKLSGTALQRIVCAAQDNNAEAVRLMLAAGWPVGTKGQDGVTALHWAGFHGNRAMALAILRHAPPLEVQDSSFHSTPLGWAIYGSIHGWHCKTGDHGGVVEALLEAGAAPPDADWEASQPVLAALRARRG